ncbi:MAG: alpha/beta fold hydrolase [Myxococcota bacterium]
MWMLLHGFTGSPKSWDLVAEELSRNDAVLRPHILGHGPDWRDRHVATFEAEVGRLAALAKTMPEPRYLCGYSMGARLALGLLARAVPGFDGAVLIGAHPGLTRDDERAARREVDAERSALLRRGGTDAFVAAWETNPLFASQSKLPEPTRVRQREIRTSHDPEGLATALEILGLAEMPDFTPDLPELRPPSIWVAGGLDDKFSAIAGAATPHPHIVEGVGHNVVLEHPSAVVSILKSMERGTYE